MLDGINLGKLIILVWNSRQNCMESTRSSQSWFFSDGTDRMNPPNSPLTYPSCWNSSHPRRKRPRSRCVLFFGFHSTDSQKPGCLGQGMTSYPVIKGLLEIIIRIPHKLPRSLHEVVFVFRKFTRHKIAMFQTCRIYTVTLLEQIEKSRVFLCQQRSLYLI